jgi:hypothetical protein
MECMVKAMYRSVMQCTVMVHYQVNTARIKINYIHLDPQIFDFAFSNMVWFTIRVTMGDKYDKVLNMNSLKQRICNEDTNMYISKEPMFQKNLLPLSSGLEYGGSRFIKRRFISILCCM